MDIQEILFSSLRETRGEDVMHWAKRCQTSCKQRNRAFGKPDAAINPGVNGILPCKEVAGLVKHDIERNPKQRTGKLIYSCVQSIL
jgi:hypothetical protein